MADTDNTQQSVTMMEMKDATTYTPQQHQKRQLYKPSLRMIIILFFFGGIALECVKLTLTLQCETQTDATDTLKKIDANNIQNVIFSV